MYLPEDVYPKEFSHVLNRLPGPLHEKIYTLSFYAHSVLKRTTYRDKQPNTKVLDKIPHELRHLFRC